MDDFLTIFAALDTHGPGSARDTLAALALLPTSPTSVLDIGCGPGNASLTLAQHTEAHVHALDNLEQSLERLRQRAASAGLAKRITPVHGDMNRLPFATQRFDAIWCENSVYVIGFERALADWKRFLAPGGAMVVSDLVWCSQQCPPDIRRFWADEYPDMQTMATRTSHVAASGYRLLGTHTLGKEAWSNYYQPLEQRVDELRSTFRGSAAVEALDAELAVLRRHAENHFTYVFFAMTPDDGR